MSKDVSTDKVVLPGLIRALTLASSSKTISKDTVSLQTAHFTNVSVLFHLARCVQLVGWTRVQGSLEEQQNGGLRRFPLARRTYV